MKQFFAILVCLTFCHICIAKQTISQANFDAEIILNKPQTEFKGDSTYVVFTVNLAQKDTYYVNAWMVSAELDSIGSGRFVEYALAVNGEMAPYALTPAKGGWHEATYRTPQTQVPIPITLKKGMNTIKLSASAPIVPEIEKLRLYKGGAKKAASMGNAYEQFISDIKAQIQQQRNEPSSISLQNASVNESGIELPNPKGNYLHRLSVPVKYTTYKRMTLNYGDVVSIAATFPDHDDSHFQFVLEVFCVGNMDKVSWAIRSNDQGDAIAYNYQVPFGGEYFIRVRSYEPSQSNFVYLSISTPDKNYSYTECPVTGSRFNAGHYCGDNYNYFTCNTTCDTQLFLENAEEPIHLIEYNDDYQGGNGDFDWGGNARFKKNFQTVIGHAQVASANSSSPVGTCDVYLKCKDFTNEYLLESNDFPSLKSDDAIESAPSSGVNGTRGTYNCISWAGGISSLWKWPPIPTEAEDTIYYEGSSFEEQLASFDNFFADDERYAGATAYTRVGANSTNGVIALWGFLEGEGKFTHASVRGRANNNPHGYDWESKLGQYERIFHPRDALNGGSYGQILYYYRPVNPNSTYTSLEESVADGRSVIEYVELTEEEKNHLEELFNSLTEMQQQELQNKYEQWRMTWCQPRIAIQSNPRMYAQSKEYAEFLNTCKSMGKMSWPFVFLQFSNGDFFALNAILDLTWPQFKRIYTQTNRKSAKNERTIGDAIIVRSTQAQMMRYIKELLNQMFPQTFLKQSYNADKSIPKEDGTKYSNFLTFELTSAQQIKFTLAEDATVSVTVMDLKSNFLAQPICEQKLEKGTHLYTLDIPDTYKGAYLVILTVNGKINVKKVFID